MPQTETLVRHTGRDATPDRPGSVGPGRGRRRRQRVMKWKLAVGGVVVLAAVGVGLWLWHPWRGGPQVLRLPGVVEIQEVRLASKVGGRVAAVRAAEGDLVEKGKPIVEIAMPELKAQVEQQQARVAAAEADLEKARLGARQQEKDAAFAAAAAAYYHWLRLQAGSRPEEVRQAQDDLKAAEADLNLARAEFNREEQLLNSGVGKRADYDVARANLNRAQARYNAAKARLDLVLAGSREEDIAEAAAEFTRAWTNYDLILAGTRSEDLAVAEAKAAEARGRLRELEANLEEATVRAPERVLLEVLAVRAGDVLAPNQPVARVLRAEDMWVKVYVPETDLGKVRLGQEVEVTVDAYPGKRFTGTVIQVAAVSEFTPRNVQSADERKHQVFGVKVRIDDPQGVFKSGMAAEVVVPLAE